MELEIDIDRLKSETAAAIQKGKEIAQKQKDANDAARQARINEEMAVANSVIVQIPEFCRKAAEKGKNRVCVFTENVNFESKFSNWHWTATITRGPGLYIINACKRAGLRVTTEHEDDGMGQRSWANIIVSW